MVNIIPRNDVVLAGCGRRAHREDEPGIKSSLHQLADLFAFGVTGQVRRTMRAFVPLAWIRMILLQYAGQARKF